MKIKQEKELICNRKVMSLLDCNKLSIYLLLIIILILINLFIPRAAALGISPGRTTIDFSPGLQKEVSFSVFNTEKKDMKVEMVVQGELANFISLSETDFNLSGSEEGRQMTYEVKLPNSMDPGLHTADVIAYENSGKGGESEGTIIGAAVAVVTQVYVYVPCPEKCIDADISVLEGEQNATVSFDIPIINRGKIKIEKAKAFVDIYSESDEKLASIESDELSVEPGARTELSAKWNANYSSENYVAKVRIVYDGEEKSFEKTFSIGKSLIGVERVLVNDFKLGDIAQLRILVDNKMNEEVRDVYANLLVYGQDNWEMANIKSASEDIPPVSQKELLAYWDTSGVKEGEYNGKLMIKYENKSSDRDLVLKVSQNSLEFLGVGFAVAPAGGGGMSLTTLLGIIIGILVVGNLAWFIFFRRMRKKREGISEKKMENSKGFVKVD